MQRKILFIIPGLKHGGTNQSLFNLLSLINKQGLDISIFAMDHHGPYKEKFSNQKILPVSFLLFLCVGKISNENNLFENISLFITKAFRKFLKIINLESVWNSINHVIYRQVGKKIQEKNYDSIIAFQEGIVTNFVSVINAKKKIAWIHCDYNNYLKLTNYTDEKNIYNKFDHIICVSEYTKNTFTKHIPLLEKKVHVIHNIINTNFIIKLSAKKNGLDKQFTDSGFNIISIGRIDSVKRFSEIPQIASGLIKSGYIFKWYIIGGGGESKEKERLQNNIIKYNVNDFVILLGEKNNPYPYIAESKLLICTSLSEACPYVINEAKILHIPVISTNFGSAKEFINHEENGYIVPLEKIEEKIGLMISDKESYAKIKNNIDFFTYDNDKLLKLVEALI